MSSMRKKELDKKAGELPSLELFVANSCERTQTLGDANTSATVSFIEEAIEDNQVLTIIVEKQKINLYPRKIVYLDKQLHLIGEEQHDKCLVSIPLVNIKNLYDTEGTQWMQNYAQSEVDDFVRSLQLLSECGVRLVLKITNREKFTPSIAPEHCTRPVLFTSLDGDYIWAGTLEASDTIFDWLSELGSDVEILDPTSFKKEFLNYCENKLKKLA